MRALVKHEGAGWTIELCGDDCPVQKFFVRELEIEPEELLALYLTATLPGLEEEMLKALPEGDLARA